MSYKAIHKSYVLFVFVYPILRLINKILHINIYFVQCNNKVRRANKRLDMIKCVRGKNWGVSSKLIKTMYNSLVRPLIEYVPFTTLTLHDTNHLQLEQIQRVAVRKAYHWSGGVWTSAMYKKHRIENIQARAIKLSDRYIHNWPCLKKTTIWCKFIYFIL